LDLLLLSFRYDARDDKRPSTWSEGQKGGGFGARATFDAGRKPARLLVERVRPEEAGVYRCRVDFRTAQTRNALVNVSIIGEPAEH